MILIGIMAYSGITSYIGGMSKTKDGFYTNNNMFDIELIGNNFTNEDLEKIKSIDNVNDAERKLSIKGTITDDKVLLLNFIESNNIFKFYLFDGISFDVNKSGVWLDNFYAEKNNIKVGDTIIWHIYGSDKYYTSKIVVLNKKSQNQNMTMTRSYLESLGLTYVPNSLYTNNDNINKEDLGIELVQNIDSLTESMNNI